MITTIIIIVNMIVTAIILVRALVLCKTSFARSPPRPPERKRPAVYIPQRGVQWKQGVVMYMTLCASLLHNTTQIHGTPDPLHPPLQSIQAGGAPAAAAGVAPCRRTGASTASREKFENGVRALVFCGDLRENRVFHEYLQEYWFVLTETTRTLRGTKAVPGNGARE